MYRAAVSAVQSFLFLGSALLLTACGGGEEQPPPVSPSVVTGVMVTAPVSAAAVVDVPVPGGQAVAFGAVRDATAQDKAAQAEASVAAAEAKKVKVPTVTDVVDVEVAGPATAAVVTTSLAVTISTEARAAKVAGTMAEVHVATNGNDAWAGTLAVANAGGTDGPLRTLAAAQARVRQRIAAMLASGNRLPVRVSIQPGTYVLDKPLTFGTEDSGVAGAPVSYEAVQPGTVVVSGGVALRSVTAAGGGVTFPGPTTGANDWAGGGQLYVNGRRAVLARTPNVGQYWFVQKPIPLASEAATAQGRTAFGAGSQALAAVAALGADDRSRAVVNVMHSWTTSQHRLAGSAPAGGIQLATSTLWSFLSSGTSQRYWIENVASALDAPGEFLWDASGVRYIPMADERTGTLNAVMPMLERLVVVSGDVARGRSVDQLQFRGLTFSYTRSQMPSGGFSDWQAATGVSAAIEADAATNLVIDNCRFVALGGYGVWLRRAVRTSSVTGSTFDDLGAGGIKFGQVSPWSGDALQTGANQALNNVVGNTGKVYPGAVGIWIGRSFDNKVANNLVFNTTYTGISVGWSWDFGEAASGRNAILDNLLVNIGQGVLADLAGIYTVGVSPQTRVSGNVIREVRGYPAYGAGAWGLYGDMGTSLVEFSDNIVVGADHGGFQVTTTRSNTARGNVLAGGDFAEVNVAQPDPLTALTFADNLLLPRSNTVFANQAKSPYVNFSGNTVSEALTSRSLDVAPCGSGCSRNNATLAAGDDPRGLVLSGATSTLAEKVARVAAKAGPAGLTQASSVVRVASQRPSVVLAPAITFEIDIANAAIGSQPLGFWYSTPGNIAATGIVASEGAPNGRCLQYRDSPSNVNGYDPHTYAPMNHSAGVTTGEFDLLIDANTYFVHQWRDGGSPAKTGPAIEVKAGGVYVAGSWVAPVTVGRWMKFRITAPLAGAGSTWDLQVIDGQGQVTQRAGLPFAHAGWAALKWWGFVSNAKVDSSLCLASVRATNVQ